MNQIDQQWAPVNTPQLGMTSAEFTIQAGLNTLSAAGNAAITLSSTAGAVCRTSSQERTAGFKKAHVTLMPIDHPFCVNKGSALIDNFRRGDFISFKRMVDLLTAGQIKTSIPDLGQVITEVLHDVARKNLPLTKWTTLNWSYVDLLNFIINYPRIDHRQLPTETLKQIVLYLAQPRSAYEKEGVNAIKKLLAIEGIRNDYQLLKKARTL